MIANWKFCVLCLLWCVISFSVAKEQNDEQKGTGVTLGRQLVEEARTMVHHAVKRFMIILPAIFFKLGAAFTLLILVTIAVVTNGFIGFLLLVVGLSSVLARLQHAEKPHVVPVPYSTGHIGHIGHHAHYSAPSYYEPAWKRSDNDVVTPTASTADVYGKQSLQYSYYVPTNK